MLNESIVSAVYVDSSVEADVDSQTSDIWATHVTIQMKMDWVSTQTEGLPSMGNLNVAQTNHSCFGIFHWRMGNDVSTKLITFSLCTKSSLETCLCFKLPCRQTTEEGGEFKMKLHMGNMLGWKS